MTAEESLEDAAAAREWTKMIQNRGQAWTGARPQRVFKAEVKMSHTSVMTATNTRTSAAPEAPPKAGERDVCIFNARGNSRDSCKQSLLDSSQLWDNTSMTDEKKSLSLWFEVRNATLGSMRFLVCVAPNRA